eukprot:772738-Amorphochlora_amoeboformis.AAC.1
MNSEYIRQRHPSRHNRGQTVYTHQTDVATGGLAMVMLGVMIPRLEAKNLWLAAVVILRCRVIVDLPIVAKATRGRGIVGLVRMSSGMLDPDFLDRACIWWVCVGCLDLEIMG